MKPGEKTGGKVEKDGDKLVDLSSLTGAEYFDGAIDNAEAAAVKKVGAPSRPRRSARLMTRQEPSAIR